MMILDLLTIGMIVSGAIFFLSGIIGLLRFPDMHSRLHALTKADNLGLGLIIAGLVLQSDSVAVATKLMAIWLLTLVASATSAYLIAGSDGQRSRSGGGAHVD